MATGVFVMGYGVAGHWNSSTISLAFFLNLTKRISRLLVAVPARDVAMTIVPMARSSACCVHIWPALARDDTHPVPSLSPFSPNLYPFKPGVSSHHHYYFVSLSLCGCAAFTKRASYVTHVPSRTRSDCPRLVGQVSASLTASLDIPL
jgi:hypothetical protein